MWNIRIISHDILKWLFTSIDKHLDESDLKHFEDADYLPYIIKDEPLQVFILHHRLVNNLQIEEKIIVLFSKKSQHTLSNTLPFISGIKNIIITEWSLMYYRT